MEYKLMSFRLETGDGSTAEEYRIQDSNIEHRRVRPLDGEDAGWRRLTPAELTQHVQRKTAVAQWLQRRMGWRRLLLACTNEEILREFGNPEAAVDRRAA